MTTAANGDMRLPRTRLLTTTRPVLVMVATLVALTCLTPGCDDSGGADEDAVIDATGDTQGEADSGSDALDAGLDTGTSDTTAADTASPDNIRSDAGDTSPSDGGDRVTEDADTADASDTLPASDYCETAAETFCDYYLRCDRMAVDDVATCRTVFVEACNARFEPRYTALADAGMLELSRAGLDACAAHLEQVACAEQLFDLDGGCSDVWVGLGGAGAPCGPGVESFVCDAGHTCVLSLDFCGTCEPAADIGGTCGDGVRCHSDARCVDGTCVRRRLPGESCDDTTPCVLGAACEAGTCVGFETVGLGDACDRDRRCPYKSRCAAGTCVETALLGESCGVDEDCASGRCDGGECMAFLDAGQACARATQCVSGVCGDTGACEALPSACVR